MQIESYFSQGKLLLTSEYFVLDGSLALAVPTVLGQEMEVNVSLDDQHLIIWKASHQKKKWLSIKIDYKNWQILETNNTNSAVFILNTFKIINELNPTLFLDKKTFVFETNLQFPADFGLGSSSTLMSNLAKWAKINPYLLNEKSLGGSGYDIAVAEQSSPILFQKINNENKVSKVKFNPKFSEDLILIHLNQKQNSREGIQLYRSKEKSQHLIDKFTILSEKTFKCEKLEEFSLLMEMHEMELSKFLGLRTVKDLYFSDCPVFIKSLGAWGGDFVLSRKFPDYESYFQAKNFSKIFEWKQIVSLS